MSPAYCRVVVGHVVQHRPNLLRLAVHHFWVHAFKSQRRGWVRGAPANASFTRGLAGGGK